MTRRWNAAEWRHAMRHLSTNGILEADNIAFTGVDLRRLLDASPRKGVHPHIAVAHFAGAEFGDGAQFDGVTFGSAIFTGARFGDDTSFIGASFEDNADFTQARFGVSANFGMTRFADSQFCEARFGPSASFYWTRFGIDCTFDDAIFGPGARFEGVAFLFGGSFCRATLGKGTRFLACPHDQQIRGLVNSRPLADVSFSKANLEGVDLSENTLTGADLSGVLFDSDSKLTNVRLFTPNARPMWPGYEPFRHGWPAWLPLLGRTRLGEVHWNGVSVQDIADWSDGYRQVGEDPFPLWPLGWRLPADLWQLFLVKSWRVRRRLRGKASKARVTNTRAENGQPGDVEFKQDDEIWVEPVEPSDIAKAITTYTKLADLLRAQGMIEAARPYSYRARQLERRQFTGFHRIISWGLDVVSGYGQRPGRLLAVYLSTVTIFAGIYVLLGVTSPVAALWYSFIAFHGRGVINGDIGADSPTLVVPALESVLGFLIEGLFVAMVLRRLFRE